MRCIRYSVFFVGEFKKYVVLFQRDIQRVDHLWKECTWFAKSHDVFEGIFCEFYMGFSDFLFTIIDFLLDSQISKNIF